MKTGLHTWSFRERFKEDPEFDIFKMLNAAAEMGFTAIEIMTGKANMPPDHIGSEDPRHLEKVKDYAEKRGIEIACFATYNDFAYVTDEEWRLANIEYIKRWLRLTGEVGVPNIRMLTVADFEDFCSTKGITIHRRVTLDTEHGWQEVTDRPNLNADLAIFVISRQAKPHGPGR